MVPLTAFFFILKDILKDVRLDRQPDDVVLGLNLGLVRQLRFAPLPSLYPPFLTFLPFSSRPKPLARRRENAVLGHAVRPPRDPQESLRPLEPVHEPAIHRRIRHEREWDQYGGNSECEWERLVWCRESWGGGRGDFRGGGTWTAGALERGRSLSATGRVYGQCGFAESTKSVSDWL